MHPRLSAGGRAGNVRPLSEPEDRSIVVSVNQYGTANSWPLSNGRSTDRPTVQFNFTGPDGQEYQLSAFDTGKLVTDASIVYEGEISYDSGKSGVTASMTTDQHVSTDASNRVQITGFPTLGG